LNGPNWGWPLGAILPISVGRRRLERPVSNISTGGRQVIRKQAAISAALVALVLVLCGAAFADNYTFRRTAHDDAIAASIATPKSAFPASLALAGGRVKPDETPNTDTCNGRVPKQSDLVVTGDAETRYSSKSSGIAMVDSQVTLLETAAMVKTDFARELPTLTRACSLQEAKQEHLQLVSWTRLGPARCACDYSMSFTFETGTGQPTIHLLWVGTVMRKGRVEASVLTAVVKRTSDTQNLALRSALGLQGLAVKAVASRFPAAT
jgi:hypothetical protein